MERVIPVSSFFKVCVLLSCISSTYVTAIDDPLAGLHNLSPHDDLLYDASFLNLSTGKIGVRTNDYLMDGTSNPPVMAYDWYTKPMTTETGSSTLLARLFMSKKDSKVTLQPNIDGKSFDAQLTHDAMVKDTEQLPSLTRDDIPEIDTVNYYSVAGDFDRDGVEEVIAIGDSVFFSTVKPYTKEYGFHFALIEANDPMDPDLGINVEKIYEPNIDVDTYLPVSYGRPVVGDLTGDGNLEIAFAARRAIRIYTVCSGVDTGDSDCRGEEAYTIKKRDLINLPYFGRERMNASYDINIGNFHGSGNELAIITNAQLNGGDWVIDASAYSFSLDGSSSQVAQADIKSFTSGGYDARGGYCFADTAKRNIHDIREELWVACQNYLIDGDKNDVGPMIYFFQMSFDGTGVKRISSLNAWNSGYWRLRGLAAFYAGELPNNPSGSDFHNALAFVMADAGNNQSIGLKLKTYKLKESGAEIFPYQQDKEFFDNYNSGTMRKLMFRPYVLTSERNVTVTQRRAKNMLRKGDLQGLSTQLGAPAYYQTPVTEKPSLILGAPPSHIDYIKPIGESIPNLLNISLGREAYSASFAQSESNTSGYKDQAIETLTNAASVQLTAEASYGSGEIIPSPVTSSFEATAGGGYARTDVTDVSNSDRGSVALSLNETAAMQDKLIVKYQSTEYFAYPVLGGLVCPETEACSDNEKVQQFLLYSRPSDPIKTSIDGNLLPWYQPVHEVNNILSYPRSLTQLESDYGSDIKLLNSEDYSFTTGSGNGDWSITWANGSDYSNATTAIDKGTWNLGFSGSYGTSGSFTKLTGVGYTNSFDIKYDGSFTDTGVITNLTNYDADMTVKIKRPDYFTSPSSYAYHVTPVLFGDETDYDSDDPLTPQKIRDAIRDSDDDSLINGKMKLGYYVDTNDIAVGTWWKNQLGYNQIDISLNNPTRWSTENLRDTINEDDINCLGYSYNAACFLPNQPLGRGYENSDDFYQMKGLFVTPQNSDETRYQAIEGEQLRLRARIYNYSQMDMPVDSRVRVRFYRQNSDSASGSVLLEENSAVLIGEDLLAPIPGANASGEQNWAMANMEWDTQGQEGVYYFWVVAWAEDYAGNMLTELEGKGLASSNTSPNYNDINDVPLEFVTLDNGIDYSFTNNVGMHRQEFAVLSPDLVASNMTAASAAASAATSAAEQRSTVSVANVSEEQDSLSISLSTSSEGSRVYLEVNLVADQLTKGVPVYLEANNKVVAVTQLTDFTQKAFMMRFTAQECGDIPLTLSFDGIGDAAIRQASTTAYVVCN